MNLANPDLSSRIGRVRWLPNTGERKTHQIEESS